MAERGQRVKCLLGKYKACSHSRFLQIPSRSRLIMASKGTKVTSREKKRMWELFQLGLTFIAIGKKMRRSPDTVSRYVHKYEASLNVANLLTQK